jgi:threonyl-tRNA synthetase
VCAIKPGDAAFYGPKIEVDFKDVLGRSWTLATLQIDVGMPSRFGLRYIGRDGEEHQPAMLHRAVLGSLERFIAIYIEHTGGDFPLWLAPVQVMVLPITDRHSGYASKVRDALIASGVRAELDSRNEKLGFKVREAEMQKIPIMAVIGDQEMENGTVTPRSRRDSERGAEPTSVDSFVSDLREEIALRRS